VDNTIHDNRLKHNVMHDCHDNSMGTRTAGTGNSWINNDGTTSSPPGLCGEDDNDADFETSTMYGWDAAYPWYDGFASRRLNTTLLRRTPRSIPKACSSSFRSFRLAGIRRATPSPNQ